MEEDGVEMEEKGNRGGEEVQISGICNNGEWGIEGADGGESKKRSDSNERGTGHRKEKVREGLGKKVVRYISLGGDKLWV